MPTLPRIRLRLGDLAPDLGHIVMADDGDEGSYLLMALNCWALGQSGYKPSGDLVDIGFAQTPSGTPTGSCMFNDSWMYYGDSDGLLKECDFTNNTITTRYTAATSGYVTVQSWQEDNDGGPSYVDITADVNDAGANDAQPFPSGSGEDDAVYFGWVSEQTSITVNVGTAGEGTYTVTWEYSTRAGWKEIPGVNDNTNGFKNAGSNTVTSINDTDWASTTVNGVDAFYIRARRDGGTVTTDPVLTQVTATYLHERRWSITRFGDSIIATNEFDPVVYQAGREGSFSNLIDSSDAPQARYVAVFRNRIVLANLKITDASSNFGDVGNYPYSLWWSGIGAANNFDPTDATFRSGFQTLPSDFGEITGIAECGDHLLIFFERGIRRMTQTDGLLPFAYDFPIVIRGVGTVYSRSIIPRGSAVDFWGPSGPATVTASGYTDLGNDRLSTSINSYTWPTSVKLYLDRSVAADFPEASASSFDIIGCLDAGSGSSLWAYPLDENGTHPAAILSWNFKTGRFSFPALHRTVEPEVNSIRILESRFLTSTNWELGSTVVVGIYDSDADTNTMRTFSASKGGGEDGETAYIGPARFQLAYRELVPDQVTCVKEIQIVVSPIDGASSVPSISVTVNSKDDPSAQPTSVTVATSDSAVNSGWMALEADVGGSPTSPIAARYHQIDFSLTPDANWHGSEVQAILLRYETAGDYG